MKSYKSLVAGALLTTSALVLPGVASATSTTVAFSGYDRIFATEARTEKINISYLAGTFNLSGVLDPFLTGINETRTGLYVTGASLYNGLDYDALFTWTPDGLNYNKHTFSAINLAAGNYTLKFNLIGGGFYSGSYTITPVPEPETNALMFVGLGLISLIARRKFS